MTIKTYTEAGQQLSGMISTMQDGSAGFEQKYGYFEARVKFNNAPGQWSAFWLQSQTIGIPLGDPAAAGVEMDVAEHRTRCVSAPASTPPATCDTDISDRIQQSLIWDGYGPDSKSAVQFSDPLTGLGNGSWHTWALRWTPTGLTFYYDDTAIAFSSGPISRRSQYIILSSEVGASFAGAIPASGYGSRDTTTTDMQVDYVRVWAPPPDASTLAPHNIAAPAASGTPAVGQTLACSTGTWDADPAPSFAYAWLGDGSAITGATAASYTVAAADQGHTLGCRVTATNSAGAANATSSALTVPAAPPPPAAPRQAPAPPQPPPPPPPPPPVALDRVAPTVRLSGATAQRLGRTVSVTISCPDEACRATTTGTIRVAKVGRAKARIYRPTPVTRSIAQGTKVTVKLKLTSAIRTAIKRALKVRKRTVVKLTVGVADASGNIRSMTRQIVFRR